MEELPQNFDVIVIGTGMPECIIAAAAARAGKTVLHLDRNSYYGGDWTSFNFDQLLKWVADTQDDGRLTEQRINDESTWQDLLGEGEKILLCPSKFRTITNVHPHIYVREKTEIQESYEVESVQNASFVAGGDVDIEQQSYSVVQEVQVASAEGDAATFLPETLLDKEDDSSYTHENTCSNVTDQSFSNVDESISGNNYDGNSSSTSVLQRIDESGANSDPISSDSQSRSNVGGEVQSYSSNPEQAVAAASNCPEAEISESVNSIPANCQEEASDNISNIINSVQKHPSQPVWTLEDLKNKQRKFNVDLSPKLLFARGPLVELLISSNIARYAEFKCFTRVLTLINGHLEQVPCSRADVFSTKNVSVVEKRMLMKLLTFCLDYQNHPEDYRGFEGRSFLEFLRSRKLTSNIEHYVLHAIAMVDQSTPTLQGLQATQKFLESLGRYGNSPFLWTCYGSAELPQCFCRLCAVFGGIYYLKRDAEAVILDSEGTCKGIISLGQRLNCQWLVMESSYACPEFVPEEPFERLSRAIFFTDSSVLPAEKEQLTLLRLPPGEGINSAVTVLELGPAAYVCPDKLYVVYMVCRSSSPTAEEDLEPAVLKLFQPLDQGTEDQAGEVKSKPKVLWCVFFNQKDTTVLNLNSRVPQGVLLTSLPGLEQDYDHPVKEAQELFGKMYPGEEFLPRAPDPEDIVLEGHSNPGEDEKSYSQETSVQEDSIVNDANGKENELVESEEAFPQKKVEEKPNTMQEKA